MKSRKRALTDHLKQVLWALLLVYIILLALAFFLGKQAGYETALWASLGVAGLVTATFISIYFFDLLRIVLTDRMPIVKAGIIYRKMRNGEEGRVFELVKAGFDEDVLPDVTEEGAKEFFRAAREIIHDRPMRHFILVSETKSHISGMIAVRDNRHICLFFVLKAFQGKGTGRKLLEEAIKKCIAEDPGISALEVNSSLYAVPVYKRLGFQEAKPEQNVNGIRFIPMIKPLQKR